MAGERKRRSAWEENPEVKKLFRGMFREQVVDELLESVTGERRVHEDAIREADQRVAQLQKELEHWKSRRAEAEAALQALNAREQDARNATIEDNSDLDDHDEQLFREMLSLYRTRTKQKLALRAKMGSPDPDESTKQEPPHSPSDEQAQRNEQGPDEDQVTTTDAEDPPLVRPAEANPLAPDESNGPASDTKETRATEEPLYRSNPSTTPTAGTTRPWYVTGSRAQKTPEKDNGLQKKNADKALNGNGTAKATRTEPERDDETDDDIEIGQLKRGNQETPIASIDLTEDDLDEDKLPASEEDFRAKLQKLPGNIKLWRSFARYVNKSTEEDAAGETAKILCEAIQTKPNHNSKELWLDYVAFYVPRNAENAYDELMSQAMKVVPSVRWYTVAQRVRSLASMDTEQYYEDWANGTLLEKFRDLVPLE
mmetsp:Transcript_12559/g.30904  ORF Transcript_12559/g.30904 Transcript_12559/m.30904 type:complete len:427 (-) Transcript_12559:214-1494(-)